MRNPALNTWVFQKEIDETDGGTQAGWAAPAGTATATSAVPATAPAVPPGAEPPPICGPRARSSASP